MSVTATGYTFNGGADKTIIGTAAGNPNANLFTATGKLLIDTAATGTTFNVGVNFDKIEVKANTTFNAAVTIASASEFKINNGATVTFGGAFTLNTGITIDKEDSKGGNLVFDRSNSTYNYYGTITGGISSNTVTKTGDEGLNLHGNQTNFNGNYIVEGGTLNFLSAVRAGANFDVKNGSRLMINQSINQTLSGIIDVIDSSTLQFNPDPGYTTTVTGTLKDSKDGTDANGSGKLIKSNSGTLDMTSATAVNYDSTTVKGGTLKINSGDQLGHGTNTLDSTHNLWTAGTLQLANTTNATYAQDWTILAKPENDATHTGPSGGIIDTPNSNVDVTSTMSGVISGNGPLEKTGHADSTLIWSNGFNTYNGPLTVTGGTLKITGRIGVDTDVFHPGPDTYYHGRYTGAINIKEAGTLEISPMVDYQSASGTLTGVAGATLNKSGTYDFYYTGDASAYAGNTNVKEGKFQLNSGKVYGTAVSPGTFTVHGAGVLSAGNGSTINASSFILQNNATLVLNPGSLTIKTSTAAAVSLTASAEDTINLHFVIGASDIGGAAKLSLQNGSDAIWGSGTGVTIAGKINLTLAAKGYFPAPLPQGQERGARFTLIEGLDYFGTLDSVAAQTQDNFTFAESQWNKDAKAWEVEIMKSGFFAYYDGQGNLILEQYSYVQVPEPSTYALSGAALLLGLALFRRTRQRKQAKKAQQKNKRAKN
jgi:hypothetical protein